VTYTPLTLAQIAADHMRERGLENARLESELLLASVLGIRRLDLYLQYERPLTDQEVDRFRELVRRRLRREPLQYIVGEAHFRELVLRVDARVLIPRPETGMLVGEVLAWARARAEAGGETAEGLAAVDIGTGSGAIALSLAREGPFGHIVATDLSADALVVAAENAERSGLADRVEFREGALWTPLGEDERFDVVVSNPPYIAESERAELEPEVREWEPESALFAADAGLEVLAALVAGASAHLRPGGLLALEVGADQAAEVAARIEGTGAFGGARIVRDLAGRERIVLAESARS
jgi:release factor glutamine methyltransferase